MKALVERLATGISVYETPDAEMSENQIAATLDCGDSKEGELTIKSKNGLPIKGVVCSTDAHVSFEHDSFDGTENTIKYKITTENLAPGQIVSGTISVVTDAGDYAIPFGITMKERAIHTSAGDITDYETFVKAVKEGYDEALIVFLSKEFKDFFFEEDNKGYALYNQVMRNGNRDIALEEFLVGMGLKERIQIRLKDSYKEYADITENYSDVIKIYKNTWGYTEIDVEVEGDFFYGCEPKIGGEQFNGNTVEYTYFINASRLHGGSNHGKITFKTSNETLVYDIIVVNEAVKDDAYINAKKSAISFVKNYLAFRTGKIDGEEWKKKMVQTAEDRFDWDENDIMGLSATAQVAILDNDESKALETLNTISGIMADQGDEKDISQYCYYLYLRSLYKNDATFTEDIKKEIKNYFENGYDTWQVLWVLFYTDDRYNNNPSLKYTLAKRAFNHGTVSPIIYFEAAQVLLEEPALLKEIGDFEIQVINFIARYDMVKRPFAKQVALVLEREKGFNDKIFDTLTKFYEATKLKDVLTTICRMIVSGDKRDKKYHQWLKAGVAKDINVTNLFEYYIYTADTSNYDKLEKNAYKYFELGTESLEENRDYFFANVVNNFSPKDKTYAKCLSDMERFATDEILAEHNNTHLQFVYRDVLNDDFVVGELEDHLPNVLHTYMIKVDNQNIKSVIVAHKEVDAVQEVDLKDGIAYVQLYTKHPVIMYVDYRGRFLSKVESEITSMAEMINITKTGFSAMLKLCDTEDLLRHPSKRKGEAKTIKDTMEIRGISSHYKHFLENFAINYFYKGYDMGDLNVYPVDFDLDTMSIFARRKVIEIMLSRNHLKKTYPLVAKYGYKGIDKKLIEKLCVELVKDPDYENNEIVVKMCGSIFRNGCRDKEVLKYLGRHYEGGSLELYQLFLASKSLEIDDNTIAERLLIQYMFENDTSDKIFDIYTEYLKYPTSSKVRKAFYTYVSYNYFIKKVQCPRIVWEILEEEYANGFNTPMICKIAFIEVMSKVSEPTKRQITIVETLINELAKNSIHFEFYKKFSKWIKIPFGMVDKTVIDFRTNPNHKVEIKYTITTPEGKLEPVVEEMGSIYQGVFTKEIIMFYGEQINYSIREYSEEAPNGKVVDNYSVRISKKDIYNDETRFGMINSMMVCKELGKDAECKEIMQTYELDKVAGKESFKLL